ncbi:protein of unknown function [Nitrospira japonica]|uniref:Uncharacterized protein n=1 Tax=Nitrospira japonica TaxID=1325564 RepID=A0A1W1I6T9_9BACT|nr:protein of unknown function [Nitrospira japonica]
MMESPRVTKEREHHMRADRLARALREMYSSTHILREDGHEQGNRESPGGTTAGDGRAAEGRRLPPSG